MSSGSSTTKVKTVGRTPRTVGPLTPEVTLSPSCAEPVGFLEKFKCIGELKSKQQNDKKKSNFSKFSMEAMINTLLADDLDEENQEDCDKVVRKINFDSEITEGKDEGSSLPEYVLKISEALDKCELREKLSREVYLKKIQAEYNENIRMDELAREMETKIIPALDKLAKDPVRIHEIMKQENQTQGIHCEVENHENFIQTIHSLSQHTQQLLELSSVDFDFEKEIDNLESIADELDVKLSAKAAEKLKQNKLKKIVEDLKSK